MALASRLACWCLAAACVPLLLADAIIAADLGDGERVILKVESGAHARKDAPVRCELPADHLPQAVWDALASGPRRLTLQEVSSGHHDGGAIPAQAERLPGEDSRRIRLTWILAGVTPSATVRRFRVEPGSLSNGPSPWAI